MRGRLGLVGVLATLCASAGAYAHTTSPHAVITAGPSGETLDTTARFEFEPSSFTAFGGEFECRIDDRRWEACVPPVALGELAVGAHSFEVRLVDEFADPSPARRDWIVKPKPCSGEPCAQPLPPPQELPPPLPARTQRRRDASGCAYGGNEPGEVAAARIRGAVRCLINRERVRRGLPRLRRSPRLEHAARVHARDMVARGYFRHASPGGRRIEHRAQAAGYLRGARHWSVGEVLAWLLRPRPTAAAIVEVWMDSPQHRRLLLSRDYREIGIAFARGNPYVERTSGATFTGALGRRA